MEKYNETKRGHFIRNASCSSSQSYRKRHNGGYIKFIENNSLEKHSDETHKKSTTTRLHYVMTGRDEFLTTSARQLPSNQRADAVTLQAIVGRSIAAKKKVSYRSRSVARQFIPFRPLSRRGLNPVSCHTSQVGRTVGFVNSQRL